MIFPDDLDRGVVSELYQLRIAVVVRARIVSEPGIAGTPCESVVRQNAVIVLDKTGGDDLVEYLRFVRDAAGDARKYDF